MFVNQYMTRCDVLRDEALKLLEDLEALYPKKDKLQALKQDVLDVFSEMREEAR
jgi:hypothetical protein